MLKTKLGSLEDKNKELVERNKNELAENEKKSKLIVKELEIKINKFSTNKRLTVDPVMMKDKQEQCPRLNQF